jgi:hypothetical protein
MSLPLPSTLPTGQYSITIPRAGFYTIVWVLSGGHGKPASQVFRSNFKTGEPILSFHYVGIMIMKSQAIRNHGEACQLFPLTR